MKKINKASIISELEESKDYFLTLSESCEKCNNEDLLSHLTKIVSSITLEADSYKKRVKKNFLIFWINFLLDKKYEQLSKEIRVSLVTIINSLDLFQLDSFIKKEEIDKICEHYQVANVTELPKDIVSKYISDRNAKE